MRAWPQPGEGLGRKNRVDPALLPQDVDFAPALEAAVRARGLSLRRVQELMAEGGVSVSVATLSYWRAGARRPERSTSLATLGRLEDILQVPRGYLASRVQTRRQPCDPPSEADRQVDSLVGIAPAGDAITAAISALGFDFNDGLRRVSYHDRMEVNADRTDGPHRVRMVLVARRDGAYRYPVWYAHDDPAAVPCVTAVSNCRLGQVLHVPERRGVAAEMLLERPLRAGQSVLVEHVMQASGQTTPVDHLHRGVAATARSLLIEVRFAPAARPVRAHRLQVVKGERRRTPLEADTPLLQMLELDPPPGVYGLSWSW